MLLKCQITLSNQSLKTCSIPLMKPACTTSTEFGLKTELESTHQHSKTDLIPMENSEIHPSQLTTLLFIGEIKKVPVNLVDKLELTNSTKINMVSFGEDQVNFHISVEVFGALSVSHQRFLSKVLSEIAGSFPLLQLLLKFHPESMVCLLTPNIHLMEL